MKKPTKSQRMYARYLGGRPTKGREAWQEYRAYDKTRRDKYYAKLSTKQGTSVVRRLYKKKTKRRICVSVARKVYYTNGDEGWGSTPYLEIEAHGRNFGWTPKQFVDELERRDAKLKRKLKASKTVARYGGREWNVTVLH